MTLEQYLAQDANYNYFVAPYLPTRDNRTVEQRVRDAAEDVRVSLTGDESWDGIADNH